MGWYLAKKVQGEYEKWYVFEVKNEVLARKYCEYNGMIYADRISNTWASHVCFLGMASKIVVEEGK